MAPFPVTDLVAALVAADYCAEQGDSVTERAYRELGESPPPYCLPAQRVESRCGTSRSVPVSASCSSTRTWFFAPIRSTCETRRFVRTSLSRSASHQRWLVVKSSASSRSRLRL